MSSFAKLFRKKALPKGATLDMARALDRRMRGEKLHYFDADDANRLLGLIESERAARADIDWDSRDRELREEHERARTGSSPGMATREASPGSSARPRADPSALRPSTPGVGGSGGGAGALRSSFNGRTCSPGDLKTRIGQLGLDTSWYVENNCTETARQMAKGPSVGITLKAARVASEAEARRVRRETDLAAGAIDARSADPEKVRERLAVLGISHDLQAGIRENGKPLPPRDDGPDPFQVAAEARRRAERRARQALKTGKPADLRNAPSDVLDAYLRLRGLEPPGGGSWGPGTGTPRR